VRCAAATEGQAHRPNPRTLTRAKALSFFMSISKVMGGDENRTVASVI
jgi:hypothetical protein